MTDNEMECRNQRLSWYKEQIKKMVDEIDIKKSFADGDLQFLYGAAKAARNDVG